MRPLSYATVRHVSSQFDLTSLLASPSKELTSTARDVVTTDCGIRKMVETYDVAMNAASLRSRKW